MAHYLGDYEWISACVSEAGSEGMSQVVKAKVIELRVFACSSETLLNIAQCGVSSFVLENHVGCPLDGTRSYCQCILNNLVHRNGPHLAVLCGLPRNAN